MKIDVTHKYFFFLPPPPSNIFFFQTSFKVEPNNKFELENIMFYTNLETYRPFIYIVMIAYPFIGGWGLFSKKKDRRVVNFFLNVEEHSNENFCLETVLIKASISYHSETYLSLDQIEMLNILELEFFLLDELSQRFEPSLEEFVNSLKNENQYDDVNFIYQKSKTNDLFKEKCQVNFCEFIEIN